MTDISTQPGLATKISVLVVDDEADHRYLIEQRLRNEGMDVRVAESGDEALQMLDGIDLVLLDYVLPGRSGLETLREIREVGGPSVIMVTAMGSEGIAVEAMRAGAVDYLVKDGRYLQNLSQVVERAWRIHDLTRRARELQRLALLVASATDRDSTFGEIVQGAQRLLRADSCVLFLAQGSTLVVNGSSGETTLGQQVIRERVSEVLGSPEPVVESWEDATCLAVPISSMDGIPLAVLAVLTEVDRVFDKEELELAQAFAGFCGLALARMNQLELERSLVSELEDMLEMRRELVASVSHELRTPLTCILGFTSTLANHWYDLDDESRREFLDKVRRNGLELADLVDRLLDFASTEAGRLQASTVDVRVEDELREVVVHLSPMLSGREVIIEGDPVRAAADPVLLRRTVTNLVSNAVKYSNPGAPIRLTTVTDGEWVRISIRDAGMGLSEEELSRIFEPFWRAGRGVNRKRGTGIGLALVRDYVRLMGGTISVESTLGHGSTFTFTLKALG